MEKRVGLGPSLGASQTMRNQQSKKRHSNEKPSKDNMSRTRE